MAVIVTRAPLPPPSPREDWDRALASASSARLEHLKVLLERCELEGLLGGSSTLEKMSYDALMNGLDCVSELISYTRVIHGNQLDAMMRDEWVYDLILLAERLLLDHVGNMRQQDPKNVVQVTIDDNVGVSDVLTSIERKSPGQRNELEKSVAAQAAEIEKLRLRTAELEEARLKEQSRANDSDKRAFDLRRDEREHQQKMREAKYRSWRDLMNRDFVAASVGALLLIGFGVTLVVAMFLGTKPLDAVSNAFLLILGYFFGQGAAARTDRRRDESA